MIGVFWKILNHNIIDNKKKREKHVGNRTCDHYNLSECTSKSRALLNSCDNKHYHNLSLKNGEKTE